MKNMIVILSLLWGLIVCGAVTAQPKATDVNGVRPGMTPNEVRAAIKAYNSRLRITEVPHHYEKGLPGGGLGAIWAMSDGCRFNGSFLICDKGADAWEFIAVGFARMSNAAVIVFNHQKHATPPPLSEMSRFEEKYGPKMHKGIGTETYLWGWDDKGAPKVPCVLDAMPQLSKATHTVLHGRPTDGCGVSIYARVNPNPSRYDADYEVVVFDGQLNSLDVAARKAAKGSDTTKSGSQVGKR